jgi:hypothetical protein
LNSNEDWCVVHNETISGKSVSCIRWKTFYLQYYTCGLENHMLELKTFFLSVNEVYKIELTHTCFSLIFKMYRESLLTDMGQFFFFFNFHPYYEITKENMKNNRNMEVLFFWEEMKTLASSTLLRD